MQKEVNKREDRNQMTTSKSNRTKRSKRQNYNAPRKRERTQVRKRNTEERKNIANNKTCIDEKEPKFENL